MPREPTTESATAVQDKLLEAVKVGRETSLEAVTEWVDAFSSIMPKMPEWAGAFTSMIPKMPGSAAQSPAGTSKIPDLWQLPSIENLVGFSEKLWEGQREFNMSLYETIAPLGRSAFDAAKSTAAKADAAAASAEHSPTSTTKATTAKA